MRRFAPWLGLIGATVFLAWRTIRGITTRVGHPAGTLDDTYIHFQYARAFAEGHPFRYQAGEPISTGATSFLWPAVLGVFHLVGFHGNTLMWPAWLISFAALGALAYDTFALAEPLAGRPAALGAGAMTLFFGGLVWSAASGMEIVPFAWVMLRGIRRAAEWAEKPAASRSRNDLLFLLLLGVGAPLLRPEGGLATIVIGIVVARYPRAPSQRYEALAFLPLAVAPMILCLLLTGSARSSTAEVKLLFSSPYADVGAEAAQNARTLATVILDGEQWSAEFLPRGCAFVAWLGLVALGWRTWATKRLVRGGLILASALAIFVPCFYVTFLWNRLRYLWPFVPGWFVGTACLARSVASLLAGLSPRAGAPAAGLLAGACAGALGVRLEWVLEDVAQSASGVDRQQATLGRWAKDHLPKTARIGVNDTGAIAYFGDRPTFDIVGLTTRTEGRFWVAGAASRFEHYERIRDRLPTHFIVYPEWMACAPVLGPVLHEAIVTDSTILGGQAMRVYETRTTTLGSGERPWTPHASVVDAIDIADIESEAEHHVDLAGTRDNQQIVEEDATPLGTLVADGGRSSRQRDRFTARLPEGGERLLIARVQGQPSASLRARIGELDLGTLELTEGAWTELVWAISPDAHAGPQNVEVNAERSAFTSFHYWIATK